MALKYGSSSKSNTFTRSAFPMQSGTTSHVSAVKQVTDEELAQQKRDYESNLYDERKIKSDKVIADRKAKADKKAYDESAEGKAKVKKAKEETDAKTEASRGTHAGQTKKRWTVGNLLNKKRSKGGKGKKLDYKERIASMDEKQLKKGYNKYIKEQSGGDYKKYKKGINTENAKKGIHTKTMNRSDWFASEQEKGNYAGAHKDASTYQKSGDYTDPVTKREGRLKKLSTMTPGEYDAHLAAKKAKRQEIGKALETAGEGISRAYGKGGTGSVMTAYSQMRQEKETQKSQDILDRTREMHLDEHEQKIADTKDGLDGSNKMGETDPYAIKEGGEVMTASTSTAFSKKNKPV